ncbi:MAG: TonB C-terminal domain-containing protein [Candidatus Melainabacteria bacterium]|nr:TonB C-terminal domain-containing protein [Candidatus Melainabacteria bacterium]
MFDQSKVVLIGCLAAFACLLDNFLPTMADESTVYSHAIDAPQPVRFPRHPMMILVRPVPPTLEQRAEQERIRSLPSPPSGITLWMEQMRQQIGKEWKDHQGKKERVVMEFKVHQDGKASNIRVSKSSGNQKTDEDAVRAIERASPFKPLPRYWFVSENDMRDVQFTFDDAFINHR